MSSVRRLILPVERTGAEWFRDIDGFWATSKAGDEVITAEVDWGDRLASGETVSAVTYDDSGVTTSGASLSSNVSSVNVTGHGSVRLTATTSASRTLIEDLRFYPVEPRKTVNDYRYST